MTANFRFNNSEVCCISDVHIGIHQNSQMWLDITAQWADWLIGELNDKNITDIIICGDLFHYRDEISVNTLQAVTDILYKFNDFNIIMLVGNHDAYYKDRSDVNSMAILSGWSNITVISDVTTIKQFNKTYTFAPWEPEFTKIPKSDILFGHFEIESFKMNHFKICTFGVKTKDLLSRASTIITGHFHAREEREYKNGNIVYLGNPFHMDFGNVGEVKGYYILNLKNSEYNFYENTISPKHRKILLSQLVAQGDITSEVKKSFKNAIVRFVVDRNIAPDEVDKLLKLFASYNPLTMHVDYAINFDKFGMDENEDHDLSGVSIETAIEEFVNLLDIDGKKEIIDYTTDLYKRAK